MPSLDPRRWLDVPPVIEEHGAIRVVRDDLIEGGTKLRFLPYLVAGHDELVFGGPFCGGAPLALSVIGRESGQRVTLFYARRKELVPRQRKAQANGAVIREVAPGYMSQVQAAAKKYATEAGAYFLPLGFDLPAATEPFAEHLHRLRRIAGDPPEVWCAAGSGMLARCLGAAFPSSQIRAVAVGLGSRHSAQPFTENVALIHYARPFAAISRAAAPFPSCPNYDLKAWEVAAAQAVPGALFYNVLGG